MRGASPHRSVKSIHEEARGVFTITCFGNTEMQRVVHIFFLHMSYCKSIGLNHNLWIACFHR